MCTPKYSESHPPHPPFTSHVLYNKVLKVNVKNCYRWTFVCISPSPPFCFCINNKDSSLFWTNYIEFAIWVHMYRSLCSTVCWYCLFVFVCFFICVCFCLGVCYQPNQKQTETATNTQTEANTQTYWNILTNAHHWNFSMFWLVFVFFVCLFCMFLFGCLLSTQP